MKVSVCIPTWEQYGEGPKFLRNNLDRLISQTYNNFEIIVSDHSQDDNIESICSFYSDKLNIKYVKNNTNLGNSPSNTNNCIRNSSGDIIKILFQDDFLYQDNALEIIVSTFERDKDCKWLVTGCNHTYDHGTTFQNYMTPGWNDEIVKGVNTISSPSVLSFINNNESFFDENLTMLMDCEMYYQLYKKYGLPKIVTDCLVTNRMHEFQISSRYNKNIYEEISYVKIKHNL